MNLIDIQHLTHLFHDGSCGLDDVSLSISGGEFLVVAGANGSGKTTLCRHLNGLLRPTSGTVRLEGRSVSKNLLWARQRVGMVFQNADTQIVGETVYADIAFGPENLGLKHSEVRARVEAAMETVGLQELGQQKPHLLSGGEKRKLAIAGVLAMNPSVLVFDEPFSNLDYPGSCQLLKQILRLHESGHTIIVVTHELEKVIAHIDRLILMQGGRIMEDGKPELLLKEVEKYGVREPFSSRYGKGLESWLA